MVEKGFAEKWNFVKKNPQRYQQAKTILFQALFLLFLGLPLTPDSKVPTVVRQSS